jgi:electron transfer flavoprotein alpha subunit
MPHHDQAALLAGAVRERHPRTLLLPASLQGRTVAALTAAQLETGLTADCTSLELDEESGGLLQIRPALGGNIRATIITRAAGPGRPEMATVRSGVFPLRRYPESAPQHESCVVPGRGHKLEGGPAGLRPATVRLHEEAGAGSAGTGSAGAGQTAAGTADGAVTGEDGGVDTAADVVLAVGRGIGSAERLQAFVQPLMEVLQSRLHLRVSLACSRAVVEAGILPYEYQIGQTGKSVRPSLYIAVGISGAIQHRLGMEHSSRIVSINPDAEAPIHALSDYAVVATVEEALPGLTEALRSPSAP